MERLSKFAIYLGITIALVIFTLFLYSILPSIIQNNEWERLGNTVGSTDEKVLAMYMEHPAYIAFYETYPDAKEELNSGYRGSSELQVGIMNFDTNNSLKLDMNYDKRDDRIRVNVRCDTMDNERNLRADGLFAEDFIRNTKCLDIVKDDSDAEITDTQVITRTFSNGVVELEMKPRQ